MVRCEDGLIVEAEMGTIGAYERAQVGAVLREGEAQGPTTRVAGGPRRAARMMSSELSIRASLAAYRRKLE